MSNDATFDGQEPDDVDENENFRQMRQRADDASKRAAEAERKLAFMEAGVPSEGAGSYFIKGYDGDLTAEAIRQEAQRVGIIAAPEGPSPEEVDAHKQINEASAGAPAAQDATLLEEMDAIDSRDPLAATKIYELQVKHGRWPARDGT